MDVHSVGTHAVAFLLGWAIGMLILVWALGAMAKKMTSEVSRKQDPADWWKHGGNPPGVYDDE